MLKQQPSAKPMNLTIMKHELLIDTIILQNESEKQNNRYLTQKIFSGLFTEQHHSAERSLIFRIQLDAFYDRKQWQQNRDAQQSSKGQL